MTTNEISTIVHAHACVCEGTAYRFRIRWIATEQLADPVFARVLVQVHAIVATDRHNRPAATLQVIAPLQQPAQIPLLLTDALRQHLATNGAEGLGAHPVGRRPESSAVSECGIAS